MHWNQHTHTANLTEKLVDLTVRTQKLALYQRLQTIRHLAQMQFPAVEKKPNGRLHIQKLQQTLDRLQTSLASEKTHGQ